MSPQSSKSCLPERNRRNVAAHQAIVDGILGRDPDAAEAALRKHLEDAWDQVRETFNIEH
ncbi:FCD domain-containing protein [Oceanicola sp. 502str15]|uniref:FCD domain-containing protein n=1 Tax=Oceanicola sp. 502str15 TaxID=2696061 RepID=UPI00338770F4|nr:FCD domain-containing protein [Oceanicola sp. 502str15]